MRYEIVHQTTYTYARDVSISNHIARLTPRAMPSQRVISSEVAVTPPPALAKQRVDYFGNAVSFFTVMGAHKTLTVTARSEVEVGEATVGDPLSTPLWDSVRDRCQTPGNDVPVDVIEFCFPSPMIPSLDDLKSYAEKSFAAERPLLDAVLDLTARIDTDFTFDAMATTVATPLDQVIRERRGVCQDFAHFQIGCLRAMGLPARYVSGYLETTPPPGQQRLVGADASHAWVQVYAPFIGWLDVDPTNNLLPSTRHITLAWGRDFDDVSPVRGVIVGGGAHELEVAVDVIRKES